MDKLHKDGFHVFHDWYSGRGNVDHFVVGPQGVFAIETKSWTGEIRCAGGTLLRGGEPISGKNPFKQARGEAADVSRLIKESRDVSVWVSPILCFSRAELRCYETVEGVMLSDVGSLRRTMLERPERHTPQRVNSISYFLEKHLGVSASAKPNSPPRRAGRSRSLLRLDRVFVAVYLLFVLCLTLVFADSTAVLLQRAADLYRLVGQAWGALLWGSKHGDAWVGQSTTASEEWIGAAMSEEKNVDKVNEAQAPQGEMGQRYLASGESVSMRLWENEQPGEPKPEAAREYETVGYVISGRAELRLEGEGIPLSAGDSWTVPKGASHTYNILESFTAVEATSPPAEAGRRDEP